MAEPANQGWARTVRRSEARGQALEGEIWTSYCFPIALHGELGGQTGLRARRAGRLDGATTMADGIVSDAFHAV